MESAESDGRSLIDYQDLYQDKASASLRSSELAGRSFFAYIGVLEREAAGIRQARECMPLREQTSCILCEAAAAAAITLFCIFSLLPSALLLFSLSIEAGFEAKTLIASLWANTHCSEVVESPLRAGHATQSRSNAKTAKSLVSSRCRRVASADVQTRLRILIGGSRTRSSVLALSSQPAVADLSLSYKVACLLVQIASSITHPRAPAFLGRDITCRSWEGA